MLNWGEIFDNCEMAVKKMIVSHLIERVTISREGKIEIKFNISLEQYLKFTGKQLETHTAK